MAKKDGELTPMMKQFFDLKAKHPDALMLFRCGDFYETYCDDAVEASRILGITLTKRNNGAGAKGDEMAGFPHHALDTYLPKLIRAGKRVAICDQLEDPKLTKKLVKRGITELVTPGVALSDNVLNYKENNFLCAVHFGRGACGISLLDISTGEYLVGEGTYDYVDKLMGNFQPKEVLYDRERRQDFERYFGTRWTTFQMDDWVFTEQTAQQKLLRHFQVKSMKGFGVDHLRSGLVAAGAILQYLELTQHTQISHITHISRIEEEKYVRLDKFTIRSLELIQPMQDDGRSLLDVVDRTVSPMGGRLLRRWLVFPLKERAAIEARLDVVDFFFREPEFCQVIDAQLRRVGDLERIISKVAVGRVTPREVVQLRVALEAVAVIRHACALCCGNAATNQTGSPAPESPAPSGSPTPASSGSPAAPSGSPAASSGSPAASSCPVSCGSAAANASGQAPAAPGNAVIAQIADRLDLCPDIRDCIAREVQNDPPQLVQKGGVIASGVNDELDELRRIAYSGKDYLLQIQEREAQLTGIQSLKIGYNNVFGYYLEVRNTYKDKVPPEWVRKQTLAQAERYITQELKDYEEKILGAEEKILALEARLFAELVQAIQAFIPQIQTDAMLLARLDCLLSFAKTAEEHRYIRPVVDDSDVIDIRQGRHPVIETELPVDEPYVPNDVMLDQDRQQIIIITGPNMAGKSALLRQTALIVLLAQVGSFVPAESARIGLVDKIFTRVGASDNISLGESTFMVEMTEASNILNNVTPRSLVLFDELGRGTSTYDGISIAWAIVEYLHEQPKARARTLFATHYHELNEMEKNFSRIKNYNVSVREVDGRVIFLRKLERGGSEHSFGIHVAEIAGMPRSIVKRANTVLRQLESENAQVGKAGRPLAEIADSREGMQLSFFQLDDPVLIQVRDEILTLDINNLTPMEAINKLWEIKKIVGGK